MLFPQNKVTVEIGLDSSKRHLEKIAFDPISFGVSLAAGEAIMGGIARFGKSRGANLLSAGIQHGRKGEKMNPYTEGISRNLLGNKQMAPYDAGLQVGNKIRQSGMSPDKGERFVNKAVGIASARKDRLAAETGKKVKDPVLNAMEEFQQGRDLHFPRTDRLFNKGTVPQDKNTVLANATVNTAMLPGALLDFRAAARPAVRAAENNPKVQEVTDKLFPAGTKREKTYNAVRDYID